MGEIEGAAYGGAVCDDLRVRLHEPGILVVTFNAPGRLNALNQAMKRDLIELIARAQM